MPLNVDVLMNLKFGDAEEVVKEDEIIVQKLATFLKEDIIKATVADFEQRITIPSDSETLINILHSRGINLRYLGYVATLCAQNNRAPFVYVLTQIFSKFI
jgi:protein TIF31